MKFNFTRTTEVNTEAWSKSNIKLEQDLNKLVSGTVSENEINSYLEDMCKELLPVERDTCKDMLFLMYDEPATMPADGRVEFVYKPTYLAATIMLTAMNRFETLAQNDIFKNNLAALLNASTARGFRGAGYDEFDGFIDTLKIFATGDTVEFIKKYPTISPIFIDEFNEAVELLENKICTGIIKNMWSGDDYSKKGREVLDMICKSTAIESEYVWYACYGSNINTNRFMDYINRCSDTTPPSESRPYQFDYPIYFAKKSIQWDNGGVAFLDDSRSGEALGRIYKITKEQYEQVKINEGPNYRKQIDLGEIEGLPVYTFTDPQEIVPGSMPSVRYFTTILEGLKDSYSGIYSDEALAVYLIDAILPGNLFRVARAIKESEHYISNEQICEIIGSDITTVTDCVEWLIEHNVIQQDRRSINAGHHISKSEAFFFTVDSPCARGLLKEMVDIISEFENESIEENFDGESEGFRHSVLSTRIERSARNRIAAIKLHGYKCQVCGFDFEKTYGTIGKNYIEVHHINPLAAQDGEHTVNPVTDLVCLCANCHRMVHRNKNQVLSVTELKEIMAH